MFIGELFLKTELQKKINWENNREDYLIILLHHNPFCSLRVTENTRYFFYFFFKILFMYLREWEHIWAHLHKREHTSRGRSRRRSRLPAEQGFFPYMRLDPRIQRSWPEPPRHLKIFLTEGIKCWRLVYINDKSWETKYELGRRYGD